MAIKLGNVAVRSAKRATAADHLQSTLKTAEAQARGRVTTRPEAKAAHWECRCGERNFATETNCARCGTFRRTSVVAFTDHAGNRFGPPLSADWMKLFAGFTGQPLFEPLAKAEAPTFAGDPSAWREALAGGEASAPTDKIVHPTVDAPPLADRFASIDLDKIQPSPTNPRKTFGIEGLQKLAHSIETAGVIQPLVVRTRFAGNYELVAGERRYRAALIARLETVPCIIRELTDAEVIEVQLLENLDREDLNPIEEAETFLQLTTTGGYTQERLAERLGCGQSHIAHRIRLLELPKDWRARVMSQDIPVTHAKSLLAWVKFPAVFDKVLNAINRDGGEVGTVKEFERLVLQAASDASRSMEPGTYYGPKFETTPEILEKLQVAEVTNDWGTGKSERAFNIKLWDKLQAAAIKKEKEAAAAKQNSPARASAGGKAAGPKKPHEPTDLQWGRMLWVWRTRWLCGRLQELIKKRELETIVKLLLLLKEFGSQGNEHLVKPLGLKTNRPEATLACVPLVQIKSAGFCDFLAAYAAAHFAQGKDPKKAQEPFSTSPDLPAIADAFGISINDWTADEIKQYLGLYSDRRLKALAKTKALARQLPQGLPSGCDREYWIDLLASQWPRYFLPAELRTVNEYGKFEPEPIGLPARKKPQ